MIHRVTGPFSGDTTGRPTTRSSLLWHPTRSPSDEEAYGSCRTCGKRRNRVSHKVLGRRRERAAHNAPQAVIFLVLRMKNEEHKITAATDAGRRKELDTTIHVVASLR